MAVVAGYTLELWALSEAGAWVRLAIGAEVTGALGGLVVGREYLLQVLRGALAVYQLRLTPGRDPGA